MNSTLKNSTLGYDYMLNKNVCQVKNSKILEDKNDYGKIRDWVSRKEVLRFMEVAYKQIKFFEIVNYSTGEIKKIDCFKRAKRIAECGNALLFATLQNGSRKLVYANFCKLRLCPMCNWRRSLKIYAQVSQIITKLKQDKPTMRYIFLTLTVKNCNGNELASLTREMLKSYSNKFLKYQEIRQAIKGTFRALEVTYNQETGTYHPHLHCIFAVPSYYFSSKDYYIPHHRYRELWGQAMKLNYLPEVNVKAVHKTKKRKETGIIAEMAKYTVKPDDYIIKDKIELSTDVIEALDKALYRRRLIAFTGIFDKVSKELKQDDAIDGDLVNIGNNALCDEIITVIEKFGWNIGVKNYTLERMVDVQDKRIAVGDLQDIIKKQLKNKKGKVNFDELLSSLEKK